MAVKSGRPANHAPLWQKLAWFAGIWALSVLCIGVVAFGIRLAVKS